MLPKIPLLFKFHESDPDSGTDPECFKRLDPDPENFLSAKYYNLRPFILKTCPPALFQGKKGLFLKFFSPPMQDL